MIRKYIFALILLTAFAGCDSTPHAQWAAQRDVLTGVQNTVVTLNTSGILKTDDAKKVDPFIMAARDYLELAKKELPEKINDPLPGPNFQRYLQAAVRLLNRVEQALIQMEQMSWTSSPSFQEFLLPSKLAARSHVSL